MQIFKILKCYYNGPSNKDHVKSTLSPLAPDQQHISDLNKAILKLFDRQKNNNESIYK